MSFLPSGNDERPSFWKDLLIVALPAAIASIGPVVVSHWLSKPNREEQPVERMEQPRRRTGREAR